MMGQSSREKFRCNQVLVQPYSDYSSILHQKWVLWKKKIYRQSYLQSRNRDTEVENKHMDTKPTGKWDELGYWDGHTYTTMYKANN